MSARRLFLAAVVMRSAAGLLGCTEADDATPPAHAVSSVVESAVATEAQHSVAALPSATAPKAPEPVLVACTAPYPSPGMRIRQRERDSFEIARGFDFPLAPAPSREAETWMTVLKTRDREVVAVELQTPGTGAPPVAIEIDGRPWLPPEMGPAGIQIIASKARPFEVGKESRPIGEAAAAILGARADSFEVRAWFKGRRHGEQGELDVFRIEIRSERADAGMCTAVLLHARGRGELALRASDGSPVTLEWRGKVTAEKEVCAPDDDPRGRRFIVGPTRHAGTQHQRIEWECFTAKP
jgi:hypothetical protein